MKQILIILFKILSYSSVSSQDLDKSLDSLMRKYYKEGEPCAVLDIKKKGKIIERGVSPESEAWIDVDVGGLVGVCREDALHLRSDIFVIACS
jgi:hypothetical protein